MAMLRAREQAYLQLKSLHMESDSKQVLNAYIYDFLVKSFFNGSAATFYQEADLQGHAQGQAEGEVGERVGRLDHDTPQGYLYEWWQIFWDLCAARGRGGGSRNAQLYNESWTRRQKEQNRYRSQELKAASLQQMAEDAGEYVGEEVDPALLAMVVTNVPYRGGLRKRVRTEEPIPETRPCKRGRQNNISYGSVDQAPLGDANSDYLVFASPSQNVIDFSVPGEEDLPPTDPNERCFNFPYGM
ncbi:FLO8 (YER109C) [Zygosaccharomyces parabailii]|uniref:ZYBA0S08-02784g1_1 n=1 Tax=Zygosaccharomyces bailii (strain CLIB 213 / ATCC 58445 / CBS 680 / BCRC 21525 / NBRC 1098 / NCYC 1416 / NRRL Y-2227) TaxID=1333698 RepID=A0A8J2X9X7_ZYGB2|nr:FLO8 (YER109C) [Zygosaccharomyces parabailii]CDF90778.1 ZYBA0S08-02784g1_1 [Zygosaccharomyces bailii CLIB 213]